MYMRKNRYSKYSLDGLPPNYSGQFTEETLKNTHNEPKNFENFEKKEEPVKFDDSERLHNVQQERKDNDDREHERNREHERDKNKSRDEIKEKRDGSLLGNLFGKDKDKDGKKGGLLSGLFNFGDKDGGFLSNIELEDLILLAVIFFLLKDGIEDDIIIILAIILFSS